MTSLCKWIFKKSQHFMVSQYFQDNLQVSPSPSSSHCHPSHSHPSHYISQLLSSFISSSSHLSPSHCITCRGSAGWSTPPLLFSYPNCPPSSLRFLRLLRDLRDLRDLLLLRLLRALRVLRLLRCVSCALRFLRLCIPCAS